MNNIFDNLQTFVQQMSNFSTNSPIVVKYDKATNVFTFYQAELVVTSSSISNIYLPVNFEYAFLTPSHLAQILEQISEIVNDFIRNQKEKFLFSPIKGGFVIWNNTITFGGAFHGPTSLYEIKLYTIKNKFLVWFFLTFYSKEIRNFYKQIKSIKWK